MDSAEQSKIESGAVSDFARVIRDDSQQSLHSVIDRPPPARRLNLEPEKVKNGLGQLVLTVVKLLHELLERQAIRRMESGSLDEDQVEKLGLTLMRQMEEIERLRIEFGLDEKDLNMDLGPLGKLF